MLTILKILLVIVTKTTSMCEKEYSVELTNRSYNGVKYNFGEYFVDNVTLVERGCVCMKETCARKCCPFGQALHLTKKLCVNTTERFNPPVWKEYQQMQGFNATKEFHFLYGKFNCSIEEFKTFARYFGDEEFHLRTDGKLSVYVPGVTTEVIYGPNKYCIDTFVSDTAQEPTLNALICIVEKQDHNNYALSNSSFIIYFFTLSAFFWLNVMCYDIWWTFSGNRVHGGERSIRKRFFHYAIYAFGVPTAFTVLLAGLEFSNLPRYAWLPKLRMQGCFLSGTSKLIYLYGSNMILCIVNLTFYTLTAIKIWKVKKETNKALRNEDSFTNDRNRKVTKRFTLYVKLFTMMGINRILEVLDSIYPDSDFVGVFSDTYEALFGLITFVIFVCNKKIFNLMKKRWYG